jgi:hypothetical protein
MIETGRHATVAELASAEKINPSYVGRVLRLTLLSPTMVEAMLAGQQPDGGAADASGRSAGGVGGAGYWPPRRDPAVLYGVWWFLKAYAASSE